MFNIRLAWAFLAGGRGTFVPLFFVAEVSSLDCMYLIHVSSRDGGALALPCFALPVCVQALRVVGEGKRHRDEMADAV
jgi:hypothetical protein